MSNIYTQMKKCIFAVRIFGYSAWQNAWHWHAFTHPGNLETRQDPVCILKNLRMSW
jgi:hypothetical protein